MEIARRLSEREICRIFYPNSSTLTAAERRKLDSAVKYVERDRKVFDEVLIGRLKGAAVNAITFPDKRVIVDYRLVRCLDQDQLISVMGHEAYHAKHSKRMLGVAAVSQVAVWASGVAAVYFGALSTPVQDTMVHLGFLDIPALAATAYAGLSSAQLAVGKVVTAIKRREETKADLNALNHGSAQSMISALETMRAANGDVYTSYEGKVLGLVNRFIGLFEPHPKFGKRIDVLRKHV
jgi:Zn-dependent protease with chaperone function